MIMESYRNASGSIAIDYKKGYVLEENTNKIRCYPCYKFILIKEGALPIPIPRALPRCRSAP